MYVKVVSLYCSAESVVGDEGYPDVSGVGSLSFQAMPMDVTLVDDDHLVDEEDEDEAEIQALSESLMVDDAVVIEVSVFFLLHSFGSRVHKVVDVPKHFSFRIMGVFVH